MIKETLDLLRLADWYGQSEAIEIAKGKNQLPKTIKQGINQIKRSYKWQTRKK